jgi:hypothetical protein
MQKISIYPTSNDDSSNNRHKSSIGNPSLPLKGGQVGEKGGEKRRRGADGLIKGDGEVSERNVATHNRPTKDTAQSRNLDELGPRFDGLQRHNLEEDNGNVAENGTGRHVAHCEEDGESEAVV